MIIKTKTKILYTNQDFGDVGKMWGKSYIKMAYRCL